MLRMQKMCLDLFLCLTGNELELTLILGVSLQVSRVLEDLLGDVCQAFYHAPLSLDKVTSKRKAFKVKSPQTG